MTIVFRPSEVNAAMGCVRFWAANSGTLQGEVQRAGYELGQTKVHVAAAIGTGVHRGIEVALRRKLLGQSFDLTFCQAEAVDAYVAVVTEGGGFGRMVWDASSTPGSAHHQVERMVRAWCAFRLDEEWMPVAIEERTNMPLAPGYELSGQIDQGFDLPGAVVDVKTGGQRPTPQVQLGCYGILREWRTGKPVDHLGIDYIPRTPLVKPQGRPVRYWYDAAACKAQAWAVLRQLIAATQEWQRLCHDRGYIGTVLATLFPANPGFRLCSKTWCAAKGTAFCPISKAMEEAA